ncbi:MAG: DUF4489 domain-containing protein [Syntrophomonadaceae bacterium]
MTSKYKVSNGGDRHDDLPAKKDIVLACGSGSGAALPINSGPVPIGFLPAKVVVATVTLDTSKLDKPTVRIDFSSIVNFLAQPGSGGLSLSILFTLSRACEGSRVPLGTWTYQKSVLFGNIVCAASEPSAASTQSNGGYGLDVEVDFRESFGFSWCECQDCPDCCTYIVEVVDVQAFGIQSVSITNVSISALAVGC